MAGKATNGTDGQAAEQAHEDARSAAEGGVPGLLASMAEKVGATARVSAVFGEPVEKDGHTVIPVAQTMWGSGAGSGTSDEDGFGGGAGGGALTRPVGYIDVTGHGRLLRAAPEAVAGRQAGACLGGRHLAGRPRTEPTGARIADRRSLTAPTPTPGDRPARRPLGPTLSPSGPRRESARHYAASSATSILEPCRRPSCAEVAPTCVSSWPSPPAMAPACRSVRSSPPRFGPAASRRTRSR